VIVNAPMPTIERRANSARQVFRIEMLLHASLCRGEIYEAVGDVADGDGRLRCRSNVKVKTKCVIAA
jgi:hypothetical protein